MRGRSSLREVSEEFVQGVIRMDVVNMFAMRELRQRYRRSLIGPFWITISTAILVITLAFVFGRVFATDADKLIPFITVSIVLWTFFSTALNESCAAYPNNEEYLKTINLPISIFIFRILWSNMIVFFHNVAVYVVVALYYQFLWDVNFVNALFGFIIFSLNCLWLMFVISLICVRFRDAAPIVANILQVLFYLTPIIWLPTYIATESRYFIVGNPVYHLLEVVRLPLLGQPSSGLSLSVCLCMIVVGWGAALVLYARFRKAIPYWL